MRKNVISVSPDTGLTVIDKNVVDSLKINGTYLPDVERVLFNLKTEDRHAKIGEDGKPVVEDGKTVYETVKLANPILTTKIWWADGTTTTVKNSEHDKVETEEVDVDGVKVTVATDCSKEAGVAMAVVKRTCGMPDEKGEIVGTGMGKILREIIADGHDQRLEEAKAKAQHAKAKTAFKAAKPKKAKTKTYTQKDIIQLLGPLLEKLVTQQDFDLGDLPDSDDLPDSGDTVEA